MYRVIGSVGLACCLLMSLLIVCAQAKVDASSRGLTMLEASDDEVRVWTGGESCQGVVHAGGRMAESQRDRLRLASWNIRWFPIGELKPDPSNAHEPTDLPWLTCVLAWMNVDLFSLQEILDTPEAQEAWQTILPRLNQLTDGDWTVQLETCGYEDGHHVGFLWNRKRVSLSDHQSLWQLNPKAKSSKQACAKGYRPARYAYVKSLDPGGVDFHVAGVHFKSGPTVFALEDRQLSLNRLDRAFKDKVDKDADIVVLGDFNTIGAGDRHTQKRELKYFHRFVRREKPGFLDLPVDVKCTEYFRGRGGWLDHVLISKAMKEVTVRAVRMTGYCRLLACQRTHKAMPAAYRRLSDHCPIIVEIQNRDMD